VPHGVRLLLGSGGDVDPCSKGTYVRSLVADIGTALGPGAHLAELRRTRSGKFTIEQAVPLQFWYSGSSACSA